MAAEPPVLLAYTVNSVRGSVTVGVPLMMPLVALKITPAGSAGWMAHDAAFPPLLVGTMSVMATETSPV